MFPSHLTAHDTPDITIRRAVAADARAIERVAALDSATAPEGKLVVAEVDGCLVAAVPLDGGRPVADPFRPTAEILRLLELRVAQLHAEERDARRRMSWRTALLRPLRALAR